MNLVKWAAHDIAVPHFEQKDEVESIGPTGPWEEMQTLMEEILDKKMTTWNTFLCCQCEPKREGRDAALQFTG